MSICLNVNVQAKYVNLSQCYMSICLNVNVEAKYVNLSQC